MGTPHLSVIMGVYNCPSKYMLMRAIDSVLVQSFSDFEFIICDDGSNNGTENWLEEAAALDSRIILIHNRKNMSLAYSLNRCIEMAQGEIIARQDADDYSLPDRFKKQIEYLDSHPDMALLGTDCVLYDSQSEYGARKLPHHPKKIDFLFNSPFVHGSAMLRREVFEKVGLYRPCGFSRKYEDYDLFMRIYEQGFKGANINVPLYAFHSDKKRRVSRVMRMDEMQVRYMGFKSLGLMPRGYFYVLKPFVLALFPNALINSVKRARNSNGH